jgi:hypothetical protein
MVSEKYAVKIKNSQEISEDGLNKEYLDQLCTFGRISSHNYDILNNLYNSIDKNIIIITSPGKGISMYYPGFPIFYTEVSSRELKCFELNSIRPYTSTSFQFPRFIVIMIDNRYKFKERETTNDFLKYFFSRLSQRNHVFIKYMSNTKYTYYPECTNEQIEKMKDEIWSSETSSEGMEPNLNLTDIYDHIKEIKNNMTLNYETEIFIFFDQNLKKKPIEDKKIKNALENHDKNDNIIFIVLLDEIKNKKESYFNYEEGQFKGFYIELFQVDQYINLNYFEYIEKRLIFF